MLTLHAPPETSHPSTLVRLDGLSKVYQEGNQRRTVIDELSGALYEGEFVCLLGKSGSGKSTLLNLISGIDTPSSGHVYIRQGDREIAITGLTEYQRTRFRRCHIGIVFQFFNLIPTLTTFENVKLPLELAGIAASSEFARARDLLNQVGLGERLNTYPDKLSGGEQQRVAIARALIHNPLLLLADEPTGNLDAEASETVLSLLLEMSVNTNKMLLMATHAPEIARRADRVLNIQNGKLVGD